ncbi:MAG: hypothetical protein ACE5JX_22380 [Acidobacteriota bacterium]
MEGASSSWTTDSYLFAHSSPVYVLVGDRNPLVDEDVVYFQRYLQALIDYADNLESWHNEEQKSMTLRGFRRAAAAFARLGAGH